jgi:heme/copper-type cytochrome/quinol oxidase subunit 2
MTPVASVVSSRERARLLRGMPRALAVCAAAIVLACGSAALACPNCKQALAAQQGGGDLVAGFFWSILFMMSMPFLLVGTFSAYMYVLVRRARVAAQAGGSPFAEEPRDVEMP